MMDGAGVESDGAETGMGAAPGAGRHDSLPGIQHPEGWRPHDIPMMETSLGTGKKVAKMALDCL